MSEMLRHRSSVFCVVLLCILLESQWYSVSATTCETIRIPMCRSMPYNMTQIPNLLHHSNQLNALLVLEQYQPLVSTNCSRVLLFFLCSIFTPVCPINFSQDVIPPCQDVCLRAKHGCEPVLAGYNLTWPQDLNCDDLPPYETGVCISPEAINSSPPKKGRMILKRKAKVLVETKANRSKDCPNLSKLLSRKGNVGKQYQFIIRARVNLVEAQTSAKDQINFDLVVREIFKTSVVSLSINQTVSLVSSSRSVKKNGQCGLTTIESYQLNKDYLFMGQEQGTNNRTSLACYADCVIYPWKKSYRKTIQRWKKRQQQKTSNEKPKAGTTTKPPKREQVRKKGDRKPPERR